MSKTRMGKRVASLLLSLVMMLSLLPTTVYAEGADTGDTTDEIVGQATTSGDNTEGTGEPEPTGEGEDGSANVTEGEDGAATNDAVVEETIAPVNAEGVDAVANAESSGDEVSGEDGNELVNFVTVNGDATEYETLDAAIKAATPDANGVITYTINGKVEVTDTGWVQVAKAGLTGLTKVAFVGATDNAEICITNGVAILADETYDIDVSFEKLKLRKLNPQWTNDYGHCTNYFTTWLRNTGAAENTVTYTDCTFPNGVCNNQYGKTVFDNCQFTNATGGLYNLWNYGGNTEVKNSTFTGVRGIKTYNEGTLAVAPTVKVENTTFTGLSEKAAIVASKATDITLTNVSATDCNKGLFQKDIENGSLKTTIAANGTGISGKFDITATTTADAAKDEFNISAGTFTSEVPNDYCADGFEVKASTDASGNTTYGVEKAASYVAKIGEAGYDTLADAIAAAKDGDIVTLLADATEDVIINKNITLDLGGKTLTNTNAGKATISVSNGATATVKNGSVMGGTSYYNIEVTKGSNANLTLEDVTATAGNTGSSMIDNWGTLTINSGTYTGGLDTVKNEPGAKLTINDGTFTLEKGTSGFTGVVFNYGDLTISGGTFIQSEKTSKYGYAQVIYTDKDKNSSAVPSTVITGGTFKNLHSKSAAWTVRESNAADGATKVSGGTFNKKVSESYCADGFIPTKNADGTYDVKEGKYVAKSDTTKEKYDTLQAAITDTYRGKTVTLLTDVTENVEISKGKRVTLDLNGFTLNGGTGTAKAALTNYGTITIKDSSADKAGTIKRDDNGIPGETSYYVIDNKGTMTIESGNVINNSGYEQANPFGSMVGSSLICNGDDDALTPVLNIKGGKFVQENFIAIKNGALGVLHVTGGTITSEHSAIQNWFEATITGGTINGQLWTDAFAWKEGESVGKTTIGENAKFTGKIVMDVTGSSVPPTLAITGGDLDVTSWRITTAAAKAGAKPAISGGKFTSAVPENYCAEGFIPTKNTDNTYGVKQVVYVAETNNVKYETLQEAINKAGRNATVKMLADTRENVTIAKALTLDLNGHILNGGTEKGKPALTITARTVTITDSSEAQTGTIMREDTAENSGVSSHYVIDIQGNAWVMFEGGNVKNGSGAGGTKGASLVRVGDDSVVKKQPGLVINGGTFTQNNFIVIKVDRGYLTLKGGTLNSANTYAVENWFVATIEGGTVNGAVSSWTYSGGSNSTLTISGGTVNEDVTSVNYGSAADKQARVYITGGTVNGELDTRSYDPKTGELTSIVDAAKATIKVSGGTFNNAVEARYCDEGYTPVQISDGKYGVQQQQQVLAKIGDKTYYTMDEAFHAVQEGETIVMQRDYTTGVEQYSGNKSFTIDLNDKTWTYTGTNTNHAAFEINHSDVTLTVKNGTVASNSMVGLIPSVIDVGGTIAYDNAGLVFENVKMTAKGHSGIETNGSNTNDTVTLKNSTLDVPNGFGIYFPSSGTLTIDNSTITAKTMGVQVCAGSLSINAGSAITVSGDAVPKAENDGAIQDGAAISIVNRPGYKPFGEIAITGGTFESNVAAIKAYNWNNTDKTEDTFTANDKVFVSGGTFTSAVPEGLCAPGYVPTAVDADGNYTVEQKKVAEYNGTQYTSLQAAIDAASHRNGGQTEVTLLCNVTIKETVTFAKEFSAGSVLLNLGGYTLTGEGCRALQINKGNLYLENGTVTSTGIVNSSSVIRIGSNEEDYSGVSPLLYMRNGAKVLAPDSYGVTIFGSKTVKEKLTVAGNASIEATGPSPAISGNGDKAYHVDGKGTEITITGNAVVSATNNYAIYHPDNGTLKIQNSATVSGKGGIQMCSGTLTISGSPKIEALGKADHETGAAGPIYDVAAISVVNRSYPGGAPVVTIKGTPTVTANDGEVIHAYTWSSNAESDWADAGNNINVSGGTYSKTFNPAYLAADCTLVDGENGTYTVEQKKVAEYNSTQYTSLSQAIRDANNAGGTVKLLDNVTLTNSLGIGGTAAVTLDLNKKTLTLNGAQIYTQGSAAVIINNGTIERIDAPTSGSPNDFAIQVMSGSSLTLGATSADTVTIKSTYGVYNAGGTLTVGHATINTDGWSVAVNDSASKTGVVTIGEGAIISSQNGNCIGTMVGSKPNVTITGGQLTSNGTAWDAGVIYWASEGTLTITGGTFTASSAEGSTAAAVYQKNGTVKISGTTAKLLGNNALVVKSGEGSTGTMITELSGGTYSTRPEDSWVVNGYRAIENTDGTYTVKGANIAIQVTSRIKDDGVTTVSTTTGGGMYCEGEEVTVTTSNVVGFEFLGWYEKDSYTTKLSADLSYTFTASKNCTLVALYSPAENATLTVKVTASAFRITGSKLVQNNGGMYKLPVGSSVTVTYTDDTYTFLYWVNGSDKIVSTSPEYTFTLGSNTELRACTSPKNTGNDNAMVVFKTAYDQVLTAKRYGNDEEVVFPMGPSKTGYKFIGWSMTQAEIRAAMAENDYIVVTPKYETLGTKYTVTVKYEGIEKVADTHTINVGDSILLTAAETVGEKTFSYWMIDDQIVSYLTTLTVFESKDVTVTAVYSDEAPEAKATIRITDTTAVMNGQKYQLVFTQAYALPENATLISTGFIRATDESAAADLTLEHFAYQYVSKLTTNEGAYELRLNRTSSSEVIYVRAYVQYTDADGKLQTSYSDVVHASYDILTKGGNN